MPNSTRIRAAGRLLCLVAVLLSAVGATPAPAGEPSATPDRVQVIVRAHADSGDLAELAIRRAGGKVGRRLRIIDGFVAQVPLSSVGALASAPGILSITRDRSVQLLAGSFDARTYEGSLYNTRRLIGALDMVNRGYTGEGVDVALIDSGVAPVAGLNNSGQVIHGPDLSFEGDAPNLARLDTFGHGTHMAGLIGGRDGSRRSCLLILCSGTGYKDSDDPDGLAPEARIVSVKVANAMGATDVSQVIAGIDWVVQHRRDRGMNIRVLNLSFGTDGVQDYRIDPLAYAAEVAWHKGIVVVAAAGNSGFGTPKLNNPAYDPYVIAVGGADLNGTTSTSDDTVPAWSSKGNADRRPDLVAPGTSIASYRVPNSYIDSNSPGARIDGRLFKGTGTSQSAAVVSGAVALLLDQRPSLTPDQVKAILTSTAAPVPNADIYAQGAGRINLFAARTAKIPSAVQTWVRSTGTGSLEAARGSAHVAVEGGELSGEQDVRGLAWDGNQWSSNSSTGISWQGGAWSGNQWSGGVWNGNQWSGNQWSGNQWSGNQWSGNQWSGNQWSGNQWSGNQWSNEVWASLSWDDP